MTHYLPLDALWLSWESPVAVDFTHKAELWVIGPLNTAGFSAKEQNLSGEASLTAAGCSQYAFGATFWVDRTSTTGDRKKTVLARVTNMTKSGPCRHGGIQELKRLGLVKPVRFLPQSFSLVFIMYVAFFSPVVNRFVLCDQGECLQETSLCWSLNSQGQRHAPALSLINPVNGDLYPSPNWDGGTLGLIGPGGAYPDCIMRHLG